MHLKNIDVPKISRSIVAIKSIKLPAYLSFRVGIELKKFDPIIEEYNKARREVFEKFALKDEKGNFISKKGDILPRGEYNFKDEDQDELNEEFDKFNEVVTEVNIKKIKLSTYFKENDKNEFLIEPEHIANLDFLFDI